MPNQTSDRLIWFNGEIIPQVEAKINIMTATAQYGINVFEGIRCYYNKSEDKLYAFRLKEHLERLYNSAKLLRFDLSNDLSFDNILLSTQEIIKENLYKEDIYIKIGFFLDDVGSWSSVSPISAFILPTPKGRVFSDKEGVECCVVSWGRISDSVIPPRIKAGANYINSRFAHLEAVRNNYDLAIFMNQSGTIAEGTGSCIFAVRKGKLITPQVTGSILESITRDTVIEIAQNELNMDVVEREIDRTELYLSDELFFVGTSVEMIPILSVDKITINNNKAGIITTTLKEKYFEIVRGNNKKYTSWLTEIY